MAETASGHFMSYESTAVQHTTTYTALLALLKACIHLRTTQDAKKADKQQKHPESNKDRVQRAETDHEHDNKQATKATTRTEKYMKPGSKSKGHKTSSEESGQVI